MRKLVLRASLLIALVYLPSFAADSVGGAQGSADRETRDITTLIPEVKALVEKHGAGNVLVLFDFDNTI